MRSAEEIRGRISQAESQYQEFKDWNEKCQIKYQREKKIWGSDTDRSEMEYTLYLMNDCHKEIQILKWTLGESEPHNLSVQNQSPI